jgi:predicted nucleic-acid-binding protein
MLEAREVNARKKNLSLYLALVYIKIRIDFLDVVIIVEGVVQF